VLQEELTKTVAYLRPNQASRPWDNSVDGIVEGFKRVAAGKVRQIFGIQNKLPKYQFATSASMEIIGAFYSHYFIYRRTFSINGVSRSKTNYCM